MSYTLKQRVGRLIFPRLPVSRFLFDLLRVECHAWLVRAKYVCVPQYRARLRRIARERHQYVNVACGGQVLDGFLNIDLNDSVAGVVPWDCRTSVPVSDDAAAGIRVEHFVEHLEPREELPAFLLDARRALRPGGVLRIIVPDAARFLSAYCNGDAAAFRELGVPDPFPDDLPTRMDIVNHTFHQWHEHRWGYDFETLEHRLRAAGFSSVERRQFRSSRDPRLAQDLARHAPYSLYIDAIK